MNTQLVEAYLIRKLGSKRFCKKVHISGFLKAVIAHVKCDWGR
jgi:hypothetical protein